MGLMSMFAKVRLCSKGLTGAGRRPACAAHALVWGSVLSEEGVPFLHSYRGAL